MMKKLCLFVIAVLLFTLSGCVENNSEKKIDLSQKAGTKNTAEQSAGKPLRIAVGGMITPREGFVYYKEFLDYTGEKLGRKVEFVDREDYGEINELIREGDIDAAFVCGGPYVDGHKEFGLELIAAPVAYGETVYYSYIIVHVNNPARTFEELRGKTFAFTDPLSNSGKLVPTYMLAKMNEAPETFFRSFYYTHGHDKSIKAVATGAVDGAAVDSLIWEYANRKHPEFTSKTKIIQKSSRYGIPPFVTRPGLNPKTKEALRQVFLNAHNDVEGREILKGMLIERFVPIEDSSYDSIREMKHWVAKQKHAKK
ncbi:MAG: phosphate/phosphite/phosphonate ABC transporter substrate-binding protein [Nitrospiraceae bacterium]|nr:MAG: phosphate/phosphite/phosphonate ABC transporter substrate-binding protein [Nitrospiraceae bacterium]